MNIATGDDVKLECGSDQLCSGIKGGSEAAIHAMSGLYDEHADNGWGFLLMDAANAFQKYQSSRCSLERKSFLASLFSLPF